MPSSRYVPRAFAVDPKRFGKDPVIDWLDARKFADEELDQLGAALIQHEWAHAVASELTSLGVTQKTYSEFAGIKVQRFGRLLGGAVIARLEDMAQTARHIAALSEGRTSGQALDRAVLKVVYRVDTP